MTPHDDIQITSETLSKWLMSMPLRERKQKLERLSRRLGVDKRGIEKWRAGKVEIREKHHEGIREVMRGLDKITVGLEPSIHDAYEAKAKAHGFSTVAEYLTALAKGFLAILLLGVIGYQVSHPNDLQARRVGRRREGLGSAEMVGEA